MRFEWQFEEPIAFRALVAVASLIHQDQWSLAVIFQSFRNALENVTFAFVDATALLDQKSVASLQVVKGSYFGFGSPQQQVDMQGQKRLPLSYNMHLFLPYLLNDSQTIHSMIYFSFFILELCYTLQEIFKNPK